MFPGKVFAHNYMYSTYTCTVYEKNTTVNTTVLMVGGLSLLFKGSFVCVSIRFAHRVSLSWNNICIYMYIHVNVTIFSKRFDVVC